MAALAALAYATKHLIGRIEIVPDSQYVERGINAKQRQFQPCGKKAHFEEKITSHLEEKRPDFYSACDLNE